MSKFLWVNAVHLQIVYKCYLGQNKIVHWHGQLKSLVNKIIYSQMQGRNHVGRITIFSPWTSYTGGVVEKELKG